MGDVAQADDGVAGPHPPAPLAQQMIVHLVGRPEWSLPSPQRPPVRQVEVGPDPDVRRRRADDRVRSRGHHRRQAGLAGRVDEVWQVLVLEFNFPQVAQRGRIRRRHSRDGTSRQLGRVLRRRNGPS